MTLTKLGRILLGLCFLLAGGVAYLLGYATLIPSAWSTGLIAGAVISAGQVLWPSQFKRRDEGGFPNGVNQK
jgi:hypothetical protein